MYKNYFSFIIVNNKNYKMSAGDKRKKEYDLRPRKKNKFIIESDTEEEEESQEIEINFLDLLNDLIGKTPKGEEEDEIKKYLDTLPREEREKLLATEERIKKINFSDIPLRYKVLGSDLEDKSKALLMQKVVFFEKLDPHQSEYFKLKKYMDGILNIPFGKYRGLEITNIMSQEMSVPEKIIKVRDFISNLKRKLDISTYGQHETKSTIVEIIGKWISNPDTRGNIIGLNGPPGVGKTSLIKRGLTKALDLPFAFIPLGGSMTGTTLEGSSYTYEGSQWGRIVDVLMENKCMNPIIFFDELDKIAEDKYGDEITALLIHLTDPSQNNSFHDKYFSGIDFDLSKCFIIFSFNDKNKINPILRDRINIVDLKGFSIADKIIISRDYCLDNICKDVGIDRDLIKINDETLRVIINTYCPEKGVRKVEQCLNSLIMKINLFHLTRDIENLNIKDKSAFENFSAPYLVTTERAIKLLDPIYRKDDMNLSLKMMYN